MAPDLPVDALAAELKLYCFPLLAAGARRRLFFEGPATTEAHQLLCLAARDLRSRSEAGATMRELAAEANSRLTAQGFVAVWH
jgi:hypothetical protein